MQHDHHAANQNRDNRAISPPLRAPPRTSARQLGASQLDVSEFPTVPKLPRNQIVARQSLVFAMQEGDSQVGC
jgi:hypothetical protein